MFTRKQFAVLFILALIPFLIYQFRPDIIGFDGYHYLNVICGKDLMQNESPIMEFLILPLLPCNIIAIKFILFGLCFASVLALASTGSLYDEKNGWKAGILVWLAATFLFEFAKFENDQFAYPLIFWAIYFCLKSNKEENFLPQLFAIALLGIASFIWGGALYALIGMAFWPMAFFLQVSALGVVALFWKELFLGALGWGVMENIPLVGLPFLGISLLGVVNWWKRGELLGPGLVFLIFGILNPKFMIFVVPFLVIGLTLFFKTQPLTATILMRLAVFFAIFGGLGLLLQPPFQSHWKAIDFAIEKSNEMNVPIYHDWDLGYWLRWKGYNTLVFGMAGNQNWYRGINSNAILITWHEDVNSNCEKHEFGERDVYVC